jgi:drug/metabolite transporter (DMT)-like permease
MNGGRKCGDTRVVTAISMSIRVVLLALTTILFWSSAFAGIRVGLAGFTPYHLTLLRFAVASLAFGCYAVITRMRLPKLKDIPALFGLGLVGITLYHLALNIGQQSVSAGAASLIIAIAPVITAVLSRIFLNERFTPWTIVGLIIAFSGVAFMVVSGGDLAFSNGAYFIMFSSLCTSVYFVCQKPLLKQYKAIEFTAYITWLGTLPLLAFAPGFLTALSQAPLSSTLAGVYIGIFPAAIAYATWSMALAEIPVGRLSVFLYLNPPLAILFGFLWAGELPLVTDVIGGLIALSGVVLANTFGKPAVKPLPSSNVHSEK